MKKAPLILLSLICVSGIAASAPFGANRPAEPQAPGVPLAAESVFKEFVTAKGGQLMEGEKPFRFISLNVPNLHLVEDNVAFKNTNPWRLPDRFEMTDALESIAQMGGTVTRTYVISVVRTNDTVDIPRHVLGPNKLSETAFRALDEVLMVANQTGVRVILPLVDNWSWWGGRAEYAGFRGKGKDDFWTDPQIIADFKATIRYVLNRTNTLTGVVYRNDKAILAWETGNELDSPVPWTLDIGAFIKSLDTNHLVLDGWATSVREEVVNASQIDMVTTHHYPGGDKSYVELIRGNWEKARGKKPYFVGEFGFAPITEMESVMNFVQENGMAGAMVWSLRFHNRDGGFYWHSEPAGGNKYKSYHWPGFLSGNDYEETILLDSVRNAAYAIRDLPVPMWLAPKSPVLLPIADAAAISWQGSVGADGYRLERAASRLGPWKVVADKISDSKTGYRPLYSDLKAERGQWFYRVSARNRIGISPPSNIVGPVTVHHRTLIDEMGDFAQVFRREGQLEIKTRESRQAKEDADRVAGNTGSALVYHVNGLIKSARIYALFPKDVTDPRLMISSDGQRFKQLSGSKEGFFTGANEYGYWSPVLYQCSPANLNGSYLRIELTGETQLGRVEIDYQ